MCKKVLVLSTSYPNNVPFTVRFDGETNYNINFKFGENTVVYRSCAATLNGEFWVFGGPKRQVRHYRSSDSTSSIKLFIQLSKIIDCKLTSQGELDFDFDYGACNTFNLEANEKETALLCFDQSNSQICHWFDGEKSSLAPWTSNTHRFTLGLASYKGRPFTTGSDYPPHRFTEVGFHIDSASESYEP